MNFAQDMEIILQYAHYWNWLPDWIVLQRVDSEFTDAYSILTPFAYSYLEEMIRSTTSEYGIELLDKKGNPRRRKLGKGLISLAKQENNNNQEYIKILDKIKHHFNDSSIFDSGDNRNSVDHGYMHPINWTKDSFENLIHDIALISPFNRF